MRSVRYNSKADFFCVTVMILISVAVIAYSGFQYDIAQGQGNQNQNNSNSANQNTRNSNNSNTMNQNSRNSNMNSNGNSNMGNRNDNSGMGNRNDNSGMTGSMSAVKSADKNFMMQAAMGGMAEVEMARLALSKSSSDSVKQFAQKMLDDHSANNQELMAIASARGVTLPSTLDAKHKNLMDKLTAMSGAEFDKMYIKEMGVKAHQNMEKLLQSNMNKVSDSELKSFIAKTLPVVQEHLRMARGMNGTATTMGKHD